MVITIAGGGSTFTAGIVKSIALRREELEVDEIRLFDINKERQDKVAVVADAGRWRCPTPSCRTRWDRRWRRLVLPFLFLHTRPERAKAPSPGQHPGLS